MPIQAFEPRQEANFRTDLESDLALGMLRVVEAAAIAAAHTMGQGDRKLADQVATETMRKEMESVPMQGTIVIGEGERDEAPMLYIGEQVGRNDANSAAYPQVDIAVDPLEGTNLCATGSPGSITVLAASERHGLLHAPDCYLEKIVVGPSCKGAVDLDAPVADNLRNIAKSLDRKVDDLVIIVLERPRHEKLIADIRKAGARIRLISDGDLTAAALRCLNGYMVGRLTGYTDEQRERMPNMGIKDVKKIYTAEDLAPGKNIIFAATGVTESPLFRGVRFFGDGFRTSSLVMARAIGSIRFVDTIHVNQTDQAHIRFA